MPVTLYPAASGVPTLTASRAVVSNAAGGLAVATTTSTEIGYVAGATSNIQAQIDAIAPAAATGTIIRVAANAVPTGYIRCHRTPVSRTTYANLFSTCNVRYGAGDGSTTFGLPTPAYELNRLQNTASALGTATTEFAMTLLSDGRVLMIGGLQTATTNQTFLGTLNPNATVTWTASTAYPANLKGLRAATLNDGNVIVVGGNSGAADVNTVTIGTISGDAITWTGSDALPTTRTYGGFTKLTDGRVLYIGGSSGGVGQSTTYFGSVSGTTTTWSAGSAASEIISYPGLVCLDDNTLVLMGGTTGATYTNHVFKGVISASTTITWTALTALAANNYAGSCTLLDDGRILIIGGYNGSATVNAMYMGTPAADRSDVKWSTIANMVYPTTIDSAGSAVMSDGRVLTTGGKNTAGTKQTITYLLDFIQSVIKT